MEWEKLKVMTFNMHHGGGLDGKVDINRIADVIGESGAQVVALQEVDRYNVRSQFVDQVRKLGKKLRMHWCFATSLRLGIGRYGNATLSVWPLRKRKVYVFPGLSENRTALHAQIVCRGRNIHIFNTHLSVSDDERRGQFRRLCKALRTAGDDPAILLGDFNMEFDHPLFRRLDSHWQRIAPKRKTATLANGKEIDHIFVNRPAWGYKAVVIKTEASDHHAVVADIPLDVLQ
ncbi:MAG TPA: endonuclease/exonuclease/phosphatase family protein [Bacilli bacterium]